MKKAVSICPDYKSYFRLGDVYAENDSLSSALLYYRKGIKIEPGSESLIYGQIDSVMKKTNDVEFKTRNYLEFAKLLPNDCYFNCNLGLQYFKAGNYAKSAEFLERAATINPKDIMTLRSLISAYSLAGNEAGKNKTLLKIKKLENQRR